MVVIFTFPKLFGKNKSFHRTLNKQISHYHPKISYLADKLKYFAIEAYKKYNLALVNSVKSNENSYNIANDIFNFIKNYHRKYGKN